MDDVEEAGRGTLSRGRFAFSEGFLFAVPSTLRLRETGWRA